MAKHNRRKTMRNQRKSRGGSAWQYTTAAYGGPDGQHSQSGISNTIAANNLGGTSFCTGGSRKGGKGIITDIAVPAVLLYANNVIRGKSGKNSRKFRKMRRTFRGKR